MDADFVLHGQDRKTGPRHRVNMLDSRYLSQHLLHGRRDEILDLLRVRAEERNQNIGERDIDLRLLFAGSHEDRERTHQERRQRQQRRELVLEEEPRDPSARAERLGHGEGPAIASWALAAMGSNAIRSPAASPPRISIWSPQRCPGRTYPRHTR